MKTRRVALKAETSAIVDEDINAAAEDLGVDPRSIIRWLAGLDVRGRVGMRIASFMRLHGYAPNAGRVKTS